ncbi:hypothetical protein ACFFV7_03500 [Nonomuraea spiralis]|uniref:Uncharacterized protein n=1 Tax=Nonomuraea spiralis TaxID=46182 RepID=A0ABV5I6T5_9ACTN|nr:hypothetical protein [Nonomuraea spiralis]GGS66936.1 hypothetical protein GCM10010176_007010 [Nonomuraea spiralis]
MFRRPGRLVALAVAALVVIGTALLGALIEARVFVGVALVLALSAVLASGSACGCAGARRPSPYSR